MGVPPDGRRRRSAVSRIAILDAAEREFVERGYSDTSLRSVAVRAGRSAPGVARHFADREILFTAVLERLRERTLATLAEADAAGAEPRERILRYLERLVADPDEAMLATTLLGEARRPGHPAHALVMRQLAETESMLAEAIGPEARAVQAGCDGLRLMRLYLPSRVDPRRALAARIAAVGEDDAPRATRRGAGEGTGGPGPGSGPPPEALDLPLRERIVRAAGVVFAEEGFRRARIRAIAAEAGIPHTTLMHHFPSKEALLREVLEAGGRPDEPRVAGADDLGALDYLREVYDLAFARPGVGDISRVRSALAFEATESHHPAHDYFVDRYGRLMDRLCGVYRELAAARLLCHGVDPDGEGLWMLALWEGLRIQSFYRVDADSAELVRLEINRVLVASARITR